MKKYFTLFIFIMTLNWVMAQPALTFGKHGLKAGEFMETVAVQGDIDVTISGENVVWDFSTLNLNDVQKGVEKILTVDAQGNVTVAGKSNTLFTFSCTPSGNFWTGYSTQNYTIDFDKPVQKTQYPFQYGTTIEGAAHANITVNSIPSSQTIEGNYSSTVDGYGTIILPNGVKIDNVLRLKTVFNHAYIQPNNQKFSIIETKYLWYAQEFRCPIFVVFDNSTESNTVAISEGFLNTATNGFTQEQTQIPAAKLTMAQIVEKPLTYTIFPNPTDGDLQLSYKLEKAALVKVEIFSSYGQKVGELVNQYQNEGNYTTNYKLRLTGNYLLSISADNYNVVEQIVRK